MNTAFARKTRTIVTGVALAVASLGLSGCLNFETSFDGETLAELDVVKAVALNGFAQDAPTPLRIKLLSLILRAAVAGNSAAYLSPVKREWPWVVSVSNWFPSASVSPFCALLLCHGND